MTLFAVLIVFFSAGLHASWNLVAHARRTDSAFFLRALLVTCMVGLGPALYAQFRLGPFSLPVWGLLMAAGFFEGLYLLGLAMGYSLGEFSTVYPVARALPVLLLAGIDSLRGHTPTALGWAGILAVTLGCLLLALVSMRQGREPANFRRTLFWIGVVALATTGYTTADKLALEQLPTGLASALHYGIWQSLCTLPFLVVNLWLVVKPQINWQDWGQWRLAGAAALFIAGAYWLILWTYQLTPFASYIVGLRQFSIVLGVVVAVWLFREPMPILRVAAALVITGGILAISQA